MSQQDHKRFNDLARMIFQLNALLEEKGDALVSDLPINSSRWRVMEALSDANQSMPAAHIAKDIGLTRQNVNRLIQEMIKDGFLEAKENPYHQRAKLINMTQKGAYLYDEVKRRRDVISHFLLKHFPQQKLDEAVELLGAFKQSAEALFDQRSDSYELLLRRHQFKIPNFDDKDFQD